MCPAEAMALGTGGQAGVRKVSSLVALEVQEIEFVIIGLELVVSDHIFLSWFDHRVRSEIHTREKG